MKLSEKMYKILKWLCCIVLPAVTTCYIAISSIWGLEYTEQIAGTISALNAMLGAILGVSCRNYVKEGD